MVVVAEQQHFLENLEYGRSDQRTASNTLRDGMIESLLPVDTCLKSVASDTTNRDFDMPPSVCRCLGHRLKQPDRVSDHCRRTSRYNA